MSTESISQVRTDRPAFTSETAEVAPDWQVIAHEVTCPMCDYNLRGLSEPVCPECGYRFEWPDVVDPARRLHPYLFEHHPERNARSFAQTLMNHLRPVRFWRMMNPAQPSRPDRIVIYWLLYASANLLPAVLGVWAWYVARPISLLRSLWEIDVFVRLLLIACLICAIYPWLNFVSLMLFRQTMRRVRVKASHVLRCALYCGDVMFWNALWGFAVITWFMLQNRLGQTRSLAELLVGGAAVAGAINVVRLSFAYHDYMKFDRALATIIASQAIVAMGLFTALVYLL